jgi:short-subunit dehydrogenase
MTPVAIITGASAGIGTELARVFARHGHRLVLVARRAERMNALADEIANTGQPRPLVVPLDLGAAGAVAKVGEAVAAHDMEPQYIVNNAGFGLVGRARELDRTEQLAMIDLNVRALAELSLAFVPSLERQRGGILNVASVAGFLPGPNSAVYYAGKAFVLSLSEALHRELKHHGIRVTCLCPGPVETEFQARAGIHEKIGWPLAVSAARVAEAGYRGLMRGQRVVVPGMANRLLAQVAARWVPRGLLLRLIEQRQVRRVN